MKNFLKGSVLALLASTAAFSAQAADLGSPGYQPAAPIIGSDPIRSDEFSGFFIGGQAGAAFTDVKRSRMTTSQFDVLRVPGLPPIAAGVVAGLPTKYKENSGFSINGIVGYDVRLGDIVIGAAATAGYDDAKNRFDTVFANGTAVANGFGGSAIANGSYEQSYSAGFRVRAGYVVLPQVLAYGFAGIGMQGAEFKFAHPGGAVSRDVTVPTWTVGAGVEYALGGGWGLTAEYGYTKGMAQTASFPYAFSQSVPGIPGAVVTSQGLSSIKASSESHTVKAGVNYRFR